MKNLVIISFFLLVSFFAFSQETISQKYSADATVGKILVQLEITITETNFKNYKKVEIIGEGAQTETHQYKDSTLSFIDNKYAGTMFPVKKYTELKTVGDSFTANYKAEGKPAEITVKRLDNNKNFTVIKETKIEQGFLPQQKIKSVHFITFLNNVNIPEKVESFFYDNDKMYMKIVMVKKI